jgi:hypothetical protein
VGIGFLVRWLGWSTLLPYDEFVLALIAVGLRDAIFGIFLALTFSGLLRGGRSVPVGHVDRIAKAIVWGAGGAALVMAPFVLLGTSLIVLPLGLAVVGLLLGSAACGIKMLVQRFSETRSA